MINYSEKVFRSWDPNTQDGCQFSKIWELIETWFDIKSFSYSLSSNKNIESNGPFWSIDSLAIFCHSKLHFLRLKSRDTSLPLNFNSWVWTFSEISWRHWHISWNSFHSISLRSYNFGMINVLDFFQKLHLGQDDPQSWTFRKVPYGHFFFNLISLALALTSSSSCSSNMAMFSLIWP